MKLRQSEISFDSICSQRVTRSSSECVRNTNLIKKLPKATKHHNITSKKDKKSGKTLHEKYANEKANFIPLDDVGPKRRRTQSSSGSVIGFSHLASDPETKSSKQKKPNKTHQKNDYGRVKKPSLRAISVPDRGDIDPLSSVSQSAVKGKKSSKPVSKKKSGVILSESKSTRSHQKSSCVVIEKNSITPKVQRRVTRSSLDVMSSQSTCSHPKSQSVVSERNSVSPKDSRRVTRSSIAAHSPSTQRKQRKLPASPVVQQTEKQVKVKKEQGSKEKLSLENEDSKRLTRSSLANSNCSSVPLRNKTPICKSPTKPAAIPNPRKQTKKKSNPEKENLEFEDSSSESAVDISPCTRSLPKKAVPKDTHSVQRASRSSKLQNTSVLSSDSDTTQNGNNGVKPINKRNTRLSASVMSTSTDSSSGTSKRSASTRSRSTLGNYSCDEELKGTPIDCLANISFHPTIEKSYRISNLCLVFDKITRECEHNQNALETDEKNSPKLKKPRGVKRKSNTPPAVETKRKRKMLSITPSSTEDPLSSQSTSADEISKKHARRHTVDVLPKTKGPKNAPTTQQKGKKKSSTVKDRNASSVKTLSSHSTPDISLLPLDVISTFTAKRPKSAPAAIKKQSISKGSTSAIPKKGTLKRKRWLADALKEKNKSYEDDIFENQKFATPFRIPTEADEESDTSIATPKFGFFLTPAVAKRTPKFKDIISPSNLVKARKNAEEYLYRRQNRNKKNKIITLKTPASSQTKASTKLGTIPEKKKLEFVEAMDKMQTIKSTIEAKAAEESDEEDEDNYLSDLS